jgi:hypothetical protein
MKTRDIVKYAFAALVAGVTIAGIVTMMLVQRDRRIRGERERENIRRVFMQQGLGEALPSANPSKPPASAPGASPASPAVQTTAPGASPAASPPSGQ